MKISEKISKLDNQRRILITILYLQKHGETIFSKIYMDLKINNQTMDRVINTLKELKIVKERKIKGSNARLLSLTAEGIEIAEHIKEIKKILEGEEDE